MHLGGSVGEESACNAGDPGSTLGQKDLLEQGQAAHSSILGFSGGTVGKEFA